MIGRLQDNWQRFKKSEPGSRFQDRYHRRYDESKRSRILNLVVGVVLILGGIVSIPFPIPGDALFVPLGLIFIASEIKPVARFLDWGEVQGRKVVLPAANFWRKSSNVVRVLIVVAVVVAIAALGYGAFSLVFGG